MDRFVNIKESEMKAESNDHDKMLIFEGKVEHLFAAIAAQEKLTETKLQLQEVSASAKAVLIEKALDIQAKETERRMYELKVDINFLTAQQEDNVSQKTYDSEKAIVNKAIASLTKLVYIGVGGVLVSQLLIIVWSQLHH
jgi:primosomal protein N''